MSAVRPSPRKARDGRDRRVRVVVGQHGGGGPGGGRRAGPGRPRPARRRGRPGRRGGRELIVAGAPVFGFKLSSAEMRDGIRKNPGKGPAPTSRVPCCAPGSRTLRPAPAGEPPSTPGRAAPSARARPRSRACWRRRATGSSPSPRATSSRGSTARSGPASSSARTPGVSSGPGAGSSPPDLTSAAASGDACARRRARRHVGAARSAHASAPPAPSVRTVNLSACLRVCVLRH